MLSFAVLGSFAPLLFAFGVGDSPFIFTMWWRLSALAGCALFLLTIFRKTLFKKDVCGAVGRRLLSFALLCWLASFFDNTLYAWSTQYVDVSVTAALYETWPVFFVVLTGWLFKSDERYRKITARTIFPFLFALLGIAFVIASQAGGFSVFLPANDGDWGNLAKGAGLALGAVVLATCASCGFRWTADVASDLSRLPSCRSQSKDRLELFSAVAGSTVCNAIHSSTVWLSNFALNEPALPTNALLWSAAGGVSVGAAGIILWRMANHITANLEVNALSYATPALALAWLFAFNQAGDVHVAYLLVGIGVIIAANAGISLETIGRAPKPEKAK